MPCDVDAAVISNTRLSDDYCVIALHAPAIAAFTQPGQFVMVKTTRGLDPLLRRPFSVFEVIRDDRGTPSAISLLNKRIGVGTRFLYDVEAGARIACLGPLGRPFEPVESPVKAWMVAGGVGLAPFLTLAEALRARGTSTTLFYGARTSSDLYYVDRFEHLGVEVVLSTEDGSRGIHGLITRPLDDALSRLGRDESVQLYVCGPTRMMSAVARLAESRGCRCHVSLEQVMGCGLGGCYSCVVLTRDDGRAPHYVRSCIDGPVFDVRRIVWEELSH